MRAQASLPACSNKRGLNARFHSRPLYIEKNTLHTYNTEDHDDAPIWSDDDFANAVHRVGLNPRVTAAGN